MTQELTQINNNNQVALTTSADDLTGLSTHGRLRPTFISIVQPTTRDPKNAKPGQWLDALTGDGYSEVTVVPLRVNTIRRFYPPGSDMDTKPVCRSSDGKAPSPFAMVPQARSCSVCPHSKWGSNREKPACPEQYRLTVIVKNEELHGLPRIIDFKGTGVSVIKETLERINQAVYKNRVAGNNINLFDFFFTLTTEHSKTSKGTFYKPRIKDLFRVQNPGEFGPLFEEFVVRAQYSDDDDAAEESVEVSAKTTTIMEPEFVDA